MEFINTVMQGTGGQEEYFMQETGGQEEYFMQKLGNDSKYCFTIYKRETKMTFSSNHFNKTFKIFFYQLHSYLVVQFLIFD